MKFVKCFKEVTTIHNRPKRVRLWVISWEGIDVIGGIQVEYKSKMTVLHGIRPKARHSILSEHEFELDGDEVISKINLGKGMFINRISSDTSYGRTYGPYGSIDGYQASSSPSQKRGYFHSLRGIVLKGRYDHYIANIEFVWAVFTTNNKVNRSENDDMYYQRYMDFSSSLSLKGIVQCLTSTSVYYTMMLHIHIHMVTFKLISSDGVVNDLIDRYLKNKHLLIQRIK